jgi:hypothetical protein
MHKAAKNLVFLDLALSATGDNAGPGGLRIDTFMGCVPL